MKARKILFAVMTVATVALFNACGEDKPCDGVTCNGHGTPEELLGECFCDCETGWSGDNCDVEDKCETGSLVCLNGGTCDNNECDCAAGYEGDTCQTVSRNKFIGNYSATDNCASTSYTVNIIISSEGVDKIVLVDFGKWLCNGEAPDVKANVTGSTFTIPQQTFCTGSEFTIDEGSGTLSANQVTITVTYKTTNTTQETCTAVLTRL